MLRRLFTVCSALSLLLCAAVCVLWVRSESADRYTEPDELSVLGRGGHARYTLRSAGGRVTLLGPPPPGSANAAAAASAVAGIDNGQLSWVLARWDDGTYHRFATPRERDAAVRPLAAGYSFEGRYSGLHPRVALFAADDMIPPLLLALEDPARFVAAHYLLDCLTDAAPPPDAVWRQREVRPAGDDTFTYDYLGLRVVLRFDGEPEVGTTYEGIQAFHPCAATIDPAQLPAIRALWHGQLDRTIRSWPWWWLAAVTGVLPLGWVSAAVVCYARSRSRKRVGLCPACGYDRRATPGRCPECGPPAAVKEA